MMLAIRCLAHFLIDLVLDHLLFAVVCLVAWWFWPENPIYAALWIGFFVVCVLVSIERQYVKFLCLLVQVLPKRRQKEWIARTLLAPITSRLHGIGYHEEVAALYVLIAGIDQHHQENVERALKKISEQGDGH